MARSFHLSPYYFLLQAFDRTGEAMFGGEWSGHEVRTIPAEDDLRPIQEQRDKIEGTLRNLEQQLDRLLTEDALELSPRELERRGEKIVAIKSEQKEQRRRLVALPDLSNATNEGAERFDRRRAVEQELHKAFDEDRLALIAGDGLVVGWNNWTGQPDFALDFYLSTVTCPASIVSTGVAPAFVISEDFDKWVKRFPFALPGREVPALEAQITDWLLNAMKNDPSETIRASVLRSQAKERFPEASKNLIKQIWDDTAPASRKRAGRPMGVGN